MVLLSVYLIVGVLAFYWARKCLKRDGLYKSGEFKNNPKWIIGVITFILLWPVWLFSFMNEEYVRYRVRKMGRQLKKGR